MEPLENSPLENTKIGPKEDAHTEVATKPQLADAAKRASTIGSGTLAPDNKPASSTIREAVSSSEVPNDPNAAKAQPKSDYIKKMIESVHKFAEKVGLKKDSKEVKEAKTNVRTLQSLLVDKKKTSENLRLRIKDQESSCAEMPKGMSDMRARVENHIKELKSQKAELDEEIESLENEIPKLQTIIDAKEQQKTKSSFNLKESIQTLGSGVVDSLQRAGKIVGGKLANKTENPELKLLESHMGTPPGPNSLKQDLNILRSFYGNNIKQAQKDYKKVEKRLRALGANMSSHYTPQRMNLVGMDALNRLFLTDDMFSKELKDPNIIKGIIAMEALEANGNADAKTTNTFAGKQKISQVLSFGIMNGPSNLAIVPPNADKRDPDFIVKDTNRRINLANLKNSFTKASSSVVKPSIQTMTEATPSPYISRWERGYSPENWNGDLGKEFLSFVDALGTKSVSDLKKFSRTRNDLFDWAVKIDTDPTSGRGVQECKAGMEMLLRGALRGEEIKNLTQSQLIEKLSNSDAWLEPHIAHMALDRLHFGAMLMFQDQVMISTADGEISAADIIKGVANKIQAEGVSPQNAIAAEALFARMAIIKDFGVENLGWIEFISHDDVPLQIKEIADGKEPGYADTYLLMNIQINNQIKQIEDDNRTKAPDGSRQFADPKQKVMYNTLISMREHMLKNPADSIDNLNQFKDNEVFKDMGPLKFLLSLF